MDMDTAGRAAAPVGDANQANLALAGTLSPTAFFRFFAEIAGIPRRSGATGRVGEYLEAFARERGLECERDSVGNVLIRKPAHGSKSAAAVVLQAHQDMVCVRADGSAHDFDRDPIRLIRDGDWLHADSTTLGADDGAGMAAILAVLDDPRLVHPALEGLFTVDEETTMAGVRAVRADQLRGEVLINIDSEELGLAYVSSAAASAYALTLPIERENRVPADFRRLVVAGLKGGHSGTEIHRGRANALVLAARLVSIAAGRGIRFGLCALDNGSAPGAVNGIPARAEALVSVDSASAARELRRLAEEWQTAFRKEYRAADPDITVSVEKAGPAAPPPLKAESRDRLLAAARLMPQGVIRYLRDEETLAAPFDKVQVETSNNLGVIVCGGEEARLLAMSRGSLASRLDDVASRLEALATLVGGSLREEARSAGWEMAAPPGRVQLLFRERGWKLTGIHAGLECGTLVDAMRMAGRRLDAISVGPDIVCGHTPHEGLRIGSVQRFWDDLIHILAEL